MLTLTLEVNAGIW